MDEENNASPLDSEQLPLSMGFRILPLYSMLPPHLQLRVFAEIPGGEQQTRLIILATNVAEASITIPHIRYIVDSGRAKQRVFDKRTGSENS